MMTGFHGFHVTIGTLLLIFCAARQILSIRSIKYGHYGMTAKQHIGFEAAA